MNWDELHKIGKPFYINICGIDWILYPGPGYYEFIAESKVSGDIIPDLSFKGDFNVGEILIDYFEDATTPQVITTEHLIVYKCTCPTLLNGHHEECKWKP